MKPEKPVINGVQYSRRSGYLYYATTAARTGFLVQNLPSLG
jgi:hypothetical protein